MNYTPRKDLLEVEFQLQNLKVRIYSVHNRTKIWFHVENEEKRIYVSPDHAKSLPMIEDLLSAISEGLQKNQFQAQAWICPKCYDDHRRDGPCSTESLSV